MRLDLTILPVSGQVPREIIHGGNVHIRLMSYMHISSIKTVFDPRAQYGYETDERILRRRKRIHQSEMGKNRLEAIR